MPDDQFTYSKTAPPKAAERLYEATVKKYGTHDVPAQVSAYSAESVIMRLSVHGEDRMLGQTSELIIDVDSAQKLMNDMSREYGVAGVNLTTSKYYQPSKGTVGAYYAAGPDRAKAVIFQKKYTDHNRDWVQLSTLIHEHAHHVAGAYIDEEWSHSRGHGSGWKAQSWDMYREYLGFDDDAARRLTAKVTGETVGAAPRRRLSKKVNPKNYNVKVRWRRPSTFDPRPVHFTAEQWEPMRKGLAKVSRSVNADVKKLMAATDMAPGGSTRALAFEAKNALRDYRVDQLIAEVKGLPPPTPPKKLVNTFKPMGDKTPIGGVQLPKKTAVKFEKAVRTSFLDPFVKNTNRKLMDIAAVNQEWYAIRAQLGTPSGLPSVDRSVVARQLGDVERAHLRKTAEVFRKSIGVDIVPYLSRPEVAEFMDRRVGETVGLINTIPARHHKGLADRIRKQQLRETPFDQQRLQKLLSEQYQVSGYNLRRITRDQTSKTVGSLSQIRQAQVGVEEYDWSDSSDSRVRPTHRANNGKRFSWAEPPPTGHPGQDILCRCVARPVVTAETVNRLRGEHRETKPRTRPRDDKLPDTGQTVPVGNPLFDDPEFVDAIRRAADKLSNKYSQMEIPQVISNVLGSPSMRGHIYKDVVDVATRDINRLLYGPRGRVAAKMAPVDLPDLAGKRMSDPSVVDAVHRLRADGQSHASIADQLGRWGVVTARGVAPKRYTITAILKKFPVPRDVPAAPLRLAGRSVADLEVVAEVHRLRAAGDTHAAIARKLADMGVVTASGGVPKRYTVTSVLRKHPKPPPGVRAPGTPTPKPVTPPTPTPTVPSTLVGKTVNDLDVIAEIHRLRATGQSHAAIAKNLADRGVTTATGGVPKRYTITSALKKHPTPPKPTTPTPTPPAAPAPAPAPPAPPRKVPPIRTDRDYREWRQQEFPTRSWAERMVSGGEPIFYHTQREAIRARAAKRAPRFTAEQQKLIDAIENEAKQLTTQQPLYRGVALRKRSGDDWAKLWDAQAPKTGEVFEFHSPNPFSFSKVVAEDRTGLGNYVMFEVDPGVVKLRGGVLREHEAVVAASQKFRVVSVSKKVDRYGSTGWTYRLEPVSDIRVPKPPGTIAAPGRSVTEVADAVAAHKATVGTAKVNQEAIIGAIHDLKRGGMSNKNIADQMHSWGVTTATGKQPKPYTIASVLRRHPVTQAAAPTPPPVPVPTGPSPQLVSTIHEMRARMGTSPDVPDAIASLLKDPKFKNVYDISPSGLSADDVAAILATPPKTMKIPSSIADEVRRLNLADHNRARVKDLFDKMEEYDVYRDWGMTDAAYAERVARFKSKVAKAKQVRAGLADELESAAGVADLQKALQATFREDKVSQYIAMPRAKLTAVIRDNEIKNSAQTGRGTFGFHGKARFEGAETDIFNLRPDDIIFPELLPKYGFVARRDRINANQIIDNSYGSAYVRLKPKVRSRSTITLGDSLNENQLGHIVSPATPINKPTAAVAQRAYDSWNTSSRVDGSAAAKWGKTLDFNELLAATGYRRSYVETQIFGRLSLDDIDSILVDSKRVQKSVRRLLKKAGHGHIDVVSSGQHQRLFQIANGIDSAMESLSRTDVRRLGDFYINKIWANKYGQWALKEVRPGWRWNGYPEMLGVVDKVKAVGWAKAPMELRRQFLEEFYRIKALKGNGPMPEWGWDDFRVSKTNFTSDVLEEDLLQVYPDPIY